MHDMLPKRDLRERNGLLVEQITHIGARHQRALGSRALAAYLQGAAAESLYGPQRGAAVETDRANASASARRSTTLTGTPLRSQTDGKSA